MKKAEVDRVRVPAFAWILALCALYQLFGSGRLTGEISINPVRAVSFPDGIRPRGEEPPSREAAGSFSVSGRAGFVDIRGDVLAVWKTEGTTAMGPDRWASVSADLTGFIQKDASGAELFRSAMPGYPVLRGKRNLVVRPDLFGVSEVDGNGSAMWSLELPSMLTSFAASDVLVAAGLLDGSLALVSADGSVLASLSPGGSRLPCIYGVAISSDGTRVVTISGKDPQRVTLYRLEKSAYRMYRQVSLEGFSPEPCEVEFLPGDQGIFASRGSSWIVLDGSLKRLRSWSGGAEASGGTSRIMRLGGGAALAGGLRTSPGDRVSDVVAVTADGATPLLHRIDAAENHGGVDLVPIPDGFALATDSGLFSYGISLR